VAIVLWGSTASRTWAVHWMMHELELDYQARLVNPRSSVTTDPSFRALNPSGKIPVLQDGDFVLTETVAIISYLGDHYGAHTSLVPEPRTRLRAKYDQWCSFTMMELDAQSLYISRKHEALVDIYGEAPTAVEVARQTFVRQSKIFEQALDKAGPWALGTSFSAADILLVFCLRWAMDCDWLVSEPLQAYVERATSRPAFARTMSATQPEASA